MAKRTDLKKILIIGSGPIVIGQAAEFDYAGTQACLALKEEGYEVVLVNSNPATIMTDHSSADQIYIEPLTLETLRRIIIKEKPDSLLSTLGGQSGLTLSMQLAKEGFLEQHGVKLLGAKCETIEKAEDRLLFKQTMESIGQPCIPSDVVETLPDALALAEKIGYPVIVRPAFTMGGEGGGICQNEEELREMKGTWEAFDQHKKEWEKYGYGYINAIPAHHPALIEMYRGYNNEAWVWAPYYSIHKQLAGLIDIATYVDDKKVAAKALLIAKDMGLWVWNRLHYRTYVKTDGTREERRATPGNRYEMWNMYIAGEDGGTGESLARLSEMVKDPVEKERLLEASNFFDSPAFYEPLSRNIDDIRTRHANQHIPKITSALRSFRGNGNPYYHNIAENFWGMVQGRYSYAMGGVGNGEMFRQPYTQVLSMNTNVYMNHRREMCPNPTLNETCCAYNLAKLTKDLNSFNPDDARYMDYYERVLYNQIVGSLHPEHYLTTYHYAVGLNASKPWGNRTPQESCCGGTGSENHVKYQEAAYFTSDDCIWVGLYLPSVAEWDEQGIILEQECAWPAEHSTIRIAKGRGKFAMKLRIPYWATEGVKVTLNGEEVAADYAPCSYVTIPARKWKKGDVVEVHLPFTKHVNYGPDRMTTAATAPNETNTPFAPMWTGTLMYGPLAMGTTGIDNWADATVTLDSDLGNVIANRPTTESGTHGNLYTLTVGERTFIPDYALDRNQTHYLRIARTGSQVSGGADIKELQALMLVVAERKKAQEDWHAMAVKVPDHAPWAPHGYTRLMEQYAAADSLIKVIGDREISSLPEDLIANCQLSIVNLNAAINTMRPGNLAELEDLSELLPLITRAKQRHPSRSSDLQKAIDYADMVVSYVGDGSGTHDMIQKATTQLKKEMGE